MKEPPANNSGSTFGTAKSMLDDITVAENIYIACVYTYMRKSIDGLAAIVQQQFQLHLIPVVNHLQKELLKRDVIHCEETPVQVLKEEGKQPQAKSYMWLYRSDNDGKNPIILFDYKPSRNGNHAAAYLKDFQGYVHSDGYSGYNKLSGITRIGC